LDGKPVLGATSLGAEFEGRGDGAGDVVPGDGDLASGWEGER